jgi:5-formyltetrahydrofolate cyclo-ligase
MKKESLRQAMFLSTESSKKIMRLLLKEKRNALPLERRKEARIAVVSTLLPLLRPYKAILSFHSLFDEIDLTSLNQHLAEEGKLHLPKVDDDIMQVYCVKDPRQGLIEGKYKLQEPDPYKCLFIDVKNIDCILVPGLGFDKHHRRMGYGKGHYDRLLAQLHQLSIFPKTIGVGFKEQYCDDDLPHEPHDVPLDEVKLF